LVAHYFFLPDVPLFVNLFPRYLVVLPRGV
jgi:hypothetical protein